MSRFDEIKYQKAKNFASKFFKKNRKIQSQALGLITFNSDGFLHLIWKVKGKHKRDWKNQIKRFYLLSYVKLILKGMSHYQEYLETIENIKVKQRGRAKYKTKKVIYWSYIYSALTDIFTPVQNQ